MKNSSTKIILLLLLALPLWVSGQRPRPIIQPVNGQPAPDFNLLVHQPGGRNTKHMQLEDFAGQWLILDFWSRTCIVCIKNMPKMEKLRQRYTGTIAFLMVGQNDRKYGTGIEKLYQRIASSEKLNLLSAYDTVSFKRYGVIGAPHIAIIDPKGRLYASTSSDWLDTVALDKLVTGNLPAFPSIYEKVTAKAKTRVVATDQTFLGPRNGKHYRSTLNLRDTGDPDVKLIPMDSAAKTGSFDVRNATLGKLYLFAGFGRADAWIGTPGYGTIWQRPILELPDTSNFAYNFTREQGVYDYQIQLIGTAPKSPTLQQVIADDLADRFGYRIRIEERLVPVLELITIDPVKVTTLASSKKRKSTGDGSGYKMEGASGADIILRIGYYFDKTLIYDRSGISGRIDLDLQASMLSLQEIRNSLRKSGLDLIPVMRKLPAVIVSDG